MEIALPHTTGALATAMPTPLHLVVLPGLPTTRRAVLRHRGRHWGLVCCGVDSSAEALPLAGP